MWYLFLLLVCPTHADLTYESDVKDVSIQAAKFVPEGVTAQIANQTGEHILLLRGIICTGKEPGTDLDNPGEDCKEIYFGDDFPPSSSSWSKPQCVRLPVKHGDVIRIRLLKIQTAQVD